MNETLSRVFKSNTQRLRWRDYRELLGAPMSAALLVSITALLVFAVMLYLVHSRKPSLSRRIGPHFMIYHADDNLGGSLGLLLPVTLK